MPAFVLYLLIIPVCFAEIHSWVDKNGVKHFSDQMPPDADSNAVSSSPAGVLPSQSSEPLAFLSYDGTPDSLRRIQHAATPAAEAGQLIAIHICRQTMYGLNDHVALEKMELSSAKRTSEDDVRKWCELVESKANSGDVFFKTVLGILYLRGDGFPKSQQKTLILWQQAAEGGYHDAWCKLGNLYNSGEIVGRDFERAIFYYTKAGNVGSGSAWYNIGALNFHGKGTPKNKSMAVSCYQKAAEMGFVPAQFDLGLCYEKGYGVAKDRSQAIRWFRIAAQNGSYDARQYLAKMGEPIPDPVTSRNAVKPPAVIKSSRDPGFAVERPKFFENVEILRSSLTGVFQHIRLCETAQLDQVLKEDPTLLATTSEAGWTALTMAIASGCVAMTTYLVEHGADVNERHHELDFTPLHIAAFTGQNKIAAYLIQNGADINAVTTPPNRAYWYSRIVGTPLHTAFFNSKSDIVELLLSKGADPNVRDRDGLNLFQFAVNYNGREKARDFYNRAGIPVPEVAPTVEELLEAISACNATSTREKGEKQVAQLLKNHPELGRGEKKNGNTPLHLAVFYKMDALVNQLVDLGADVNAQNSDGITPLHKAVASRTLARYLINQGALVNAQDQQGQTPLHKIAGFADYQGVWKVARLLIDHGAKKTIRDVFGRTPYDIAMEEQHHELAKILK